MPGFLIEYHRKCGNVTVERFDSLIEAVEDRLRRDQQNSDDDLEIAAIASQSREQLEKSHSRYFFAA